MTKMPVQSLEEQHARAALIGSMIVLLVVLVAVFIYCIRYPDPRYKTRLEELEQIDRIEQKLDTLLERR